MKIKKIQINSFGKVRNTQIDLQDGVNIIYGNNEVGKSTIQKFISCILYGISKNKNGKDISDYEKYKPWDIEEFSGKIEYELDNKENFEIYRDFNKKNPLIYNTNKEEISKQFNIDKNKGNEFFYEQTKVEENLFLTTLFIEQQQVKLEKNSQNNLIQKIANVVGTGEDNVSYKLAVDRINRRQLEEVGTDRSREKPINIINNKISSLNYEKNKLEEYRNKKYEIVNEKDYLNKKILNLENEIKLLKELKKIDDNNNNINDKININKNIEEENIKKINTLKNENEEIKQKNKNIINNDKIKNKKIDKKNIALFILLIIFNFIQIYFIKNKFINYILLLTVPITLIYYLINLKNKNKYKKNIKNNLEIINKKIENNKNEINLLEKNNEFLENEINKIKEKNNLKNNLQKEKIKINYIDKIEKNKLIYYISDKNIINNLEKIQDDINKEKIKLESLKIEEKNIDEKLEKLVNINEQLVKNNEDYENLKKLEKSFELAKVVLEESYKKMRNTITPKFTLNMSEKMCKITNGKYKNINVNDKNGIMVELNNGNYIEAGRLSIGTIDQIYLALRLSMINELSEERLPIILDETFAYWDDERLENILKYLETESKQRQIIIFSCSKREINIMNNLKLNYNKIQL